MSVSKEVRWVRLGELIELCDERNSEGLYGVNDVRGISNSKEIMPTKAAVDPDVIKKFYVIKPGEFIYNPRTTRMGEKVGLALNQTNRTLLFSFNNLAFRVKDKKVLIPEYLFLFFSNPNFDRYARTNSWGSATELFLFDELCRMEIPLPSIDVQRKLVSVYSGLKSLAEENESLLQPLSDACQAFIVDCKKKYPAVKLGGYIEECNEKNTNNQISLTQGVDVNMQFIPAKREAADKEGTKIVRTGQFAFNKVVKANGTKLPIAYRTGPDCIISSSYAVFAVTRKEELLPQFLMLNLSRSEFHRYCGYISQGTTRDIFDFSNLCKVEIPLPPLSVQQKVVDLYNCYEEAKSIAENAREQLKTICPALVQKAAHTA